MMTEEVRYCHVCGDEGHTLYDEIADLNHKSPGSWRLLLCSRCSLAWVSPRPVESEISKFYDKYYTHELNPHPPTSFSLWKKIKFSVYDTAFGYNNLFGGRAWKFFGKLLSLAPSLKTMIGVEIMCLQGNERGKLLDIGCGNGRYLELMKSLGWNVTGIEPDPAAADIARKRIGGNVFTGRLKDASFPDNFFDAITINQVIEHVYSPAPLLKEIYRVLKPGGKLVIMTPNIESLGHKIFKRYWVALEPPRHVYLFSLRSLENCVKSIGFRLVLSRTVSFFAHHMWIISKSLRNKKNFSPENMSLRDKMEGFAFQFVEEINRLFYKSAGEEIFLIAAKK